jgi:hypothetical protein
MAVVRLSDTRYQDVDEQKIELKTNLLTRVGSMRIIDIGKGAINIFKGILRVFNNDTTEKSWFNMFFSSGLGYLLAEMLIPGVLPSWPSNFIAVGVGFIVLVVSLILDNRRLAPWLFSLFFILFGFFASSFIVREEIGVPRANQLVTEYTQESLKGHEFWVNMGLSSPGQNFTSIIPEPTTAKVDNSRNAQATWQFRDGQLCIGDEPCMILDRRSGVLTSPDGSSIGRVGYVWTVTDADKARKRLKM